MSRGLEFPSPPVSPVRAVGHMITPTKAGFAVVPGPYFNAYEGGRNLRALTVPYPKFVNNPGWRQYCSLKVRSRMMHTGEPEPLTHRCAVHTRVRAMQAKGCRNYPKLSRALSEARFWMGLLSTRRVGANDSSILRCSRFNRVGMTT